MAKKVKQKSITILGIEIEEDMVYEVTPRKPDPSAPDLYLKMGSMKLLNPNVNNLVSFAVVNNYWDTGFHENSFVFKKMGTSPEKAKVLAKEYKEFVADPIISFDSTYEDLLKPNSVNTFMDNILVQIGEKRQFNTENPIDRLNLYIAIISGQLAPSGRRTKEEKERGLGDESSPLYADAQYCIEAKEKVRSIEEKRSAIKATAISQFVTLLNSDKKGLISILNYEGVKISAEQTNDSIIARMMPYFEDVDNSESFSETVESYQKNNDFKEELLVMDILANKRGLHLLVKQGREYFLNGVALGTTPKQVARKLVSDSTLLSEFFNKAG